MSPGRCSWTDTHRSPSTPPREEGGIGKAEGEDVYLEDAPISPGAISAPPNIIDLRTSPSPVGPDSGFGARR
jgi:hypothetical protein